MNINSKSKLCISIITTGRCNCNCEYCHFYADHDRKEYMRDIKDDLFDRYIEYINYLRDITQDISVRFSGGEPLVMGDRMFELAERLFSKTGIRPYIMTNGKLLTKGVIDQAKASHISSFVISIENPLHNAVGTENSDNVLRRFKELQNEDVPLYFGMLVLENGQYKNILEIADFFWNEVNMIPPMCEKNFIPYVSPTENEMEVLYDNVKKLVKTYNGKADIALFPYIIPEYYVNNLEGTEYLTEFPIDDTFGMLHKSFADIKKVTEDQLDRSYFKYECLQKECDWYESCSHIKWVWSMQTQKYSSEEKMKDYCRYKKVLSRAFFDALLGEG